MANGEAKGALADGRSPAAKQGNGKQFGSFSEASSFLWSIADLLRGDFKQYDYGKVILPFTVLRRLDCLLGDTKAKVLARSEQLRSRSRSGRSASSPLHSSEPAPATRPRPPPMAR